MAATSNLPWQAMTLGRSPTGRTPCLSCGQAAIQSSTRDWEITDFSASTRRIQCTGLVLDRVGVLQAAVV